MNHSVPTKGLSASPVTIEELGEYGPFLYNATITLLILIIIYCLFKLWRNDIELKRKLVWSVILFIPIFGVLMYGYTFANEQRIIKTNKKKL